MFSFSAWSAWDFVILAIVLIPKWFHLFTYQTTPPEYISRSKKLHLVDLLVRVSFASAYLLLRTDTGWRHDVWVDLGVVASVGLLAGGCFRWLAVRPFPKLREELRVFRTELDELMGIVYVAKLAPVAILFVTAHVSFGNEKSAYVKDSVPVVSVDGMTTRLAAVSILQKTKHESGVYEYALAAYLPNLTLFRYLSKVEEPALNPQRNFTGHVILHYVPVGTSLGVNEVSKIEQFELPAHAP